MNYEAVAAQDPDLILALYSGLTQEDYDNLSAIAPTVAQPPDYVGYGIPCDELTRTVGQAIGRPAAADELVASVESFTDPLGGATSFVTALSLPFLLDGLVPMLADADADAVDGDPTTEVTQALPAG